MDHSLWHIVYRTYPNRMAANQESAAGTVIILQTSGVTWMIMSRGSRDTKCNVTCYVTWFLMDLSKHRRGLNYFFKTSQVHSKFKTKINRIHFQSFLDKNPICQVLQPRSYFVWRRPVEEVRISCFLSNMSQKILIIFNLTK